MSKTKKDVLHTNRSHVNALCARLHLNGKTPEAVIFAPTVYNQLLFYTASLVGRGICPPFDIHAEVAEKDGLYMPVTSLRVFKLESGLEHEEIKFEELKKIPTPDKITIGERRASSNTKLSK